jgi:anti-anti-sigma factor
MILVTVGTEQYSFNALMAWIDVLIRYRFIDSTEEVIVQYGSSTELPDNVKVYRRLPEAKFKSLVEQAALVIAHCGEGTALLLESLGKPYVLVPRTHRYGEHVDDHQLEMADAMERQGIEIARSPGDLVRFLSAPKAPKIAADDEALCQALSACCAHSTHKKMMLVCSSGGHYKAMMRLAAFWQKFQSVSWVTFRNPTAEADLRDCSGQVHWAYSPTNRNIPNLIRNLLLAFKVLRDDRPDVILSTGAGVAVPFLLLARYVYGSQVIFVESKTRLKRLSLSAKILKALSGFDELIVQSRELADLYPEATFVDSHVPMEVIDPRQGEGEINSLSFRDSVLIRTPPCLGARESHLLLTRLNSLEENPPSRIVLDMSETRSIDGAGLGTLVDSLKIAKGLKSKIVLWSVRPDIRAILATARLDRLFKIEESTQTIRTYVKPETQSPEKAASVRHQPIQRAIDFTASLLGMLGLIFLALPIALAIKLDSPGSVLYSQMRCGRLGKPFRVWKFRTTLMPPANSPHSPELTRLSAPKSRVGRFLDKTNLDKLPLFWNILMNDMSLVGSCAPPMSEVSSLSLQQWSKLDAKPGMAGEWAASRGMIEFEDVVELDPQFQGDG